MIVERAFAAHVAGLAAGLHVFKDDLSWVQAGEPWPCMLVTLVSSRPASKGTGRYDRRTQGEDGSYTYEKHHADRMLLRLTIRSAALGSKSGATLVDEVAEAIKGLLRAHAQGQALDLVDAVSGAAVHLEKLHGRGESEQGPLTGRVPFEAQKTIDVEVLAVWRVVTHKAQPFQSQTISVDVQ